MNKPFNEYKIYIFDLDGTLYDQPKLRITMAKRLVAHYALHPLRIRELLLLQTFRKVKDNWTEEEGNEEDIDIRICKYISDSKRISLDLMTGIVRHWIYDDPLEVLYNSRDIRLIELIKTLRQAGRKVLVLSDYPVEDKLKALGVEADGMYSAADLNIGQLKPSPKGLEVIAEDLHCNKSDMIMIGDRMEKDGMAAENFGCDYIILPRKISKRENAYEGMRI